MKAIKILVATFFTITITACNSVENKHNGHIQNNELKTKADSLMKDVDEDHITGMAKMGKLTRAEQTTRRLLDSIAKLPAKAKQAAEPVKLKLDSLQKELSYAESAMNKWMNEFNMDSSVNNVQERINYLGSEKLKVSKVKEAILNSLQKADSLLKDKF
ncbi:MAG: viral A-type inclusion protein [Chitinophagaceae bacterium]